VRAVAERARRAAEDYCALLSELFDGRAGALGDALGRVGTLFILQPNHIHVILQSNHIQLMTTGTACNQYDTGSDNPTPGHRRRHGGRVHRGPDPRVGGGLYNLNPVVTHSLKPPGFNP
jgi:hypothetical protein